MKVYRVELVVLDFENLGPDQLQLMLEDVRNLHASVVEMQHREIGPWDDANPLNRTDTLREEFRRLFPTDPAPTP